MVGASIFAGTVLVLYLASTLYHALPKNNAKRVFQVIDHSAIFLLIAGTYTPFTLGVLRGAWGWTLFGAVWGLAVLGVTMKAVAGIRWPRLSTTLYFFIQVNAGACRLQGADALFEIGRNRQCSIGGIGLYPVAWLRSLFGFSCRSAVSRACHRRASLPTFTGPLCCFGLVARGSEVPRIANLALSIEFTLRTDSPPGTSA